MTSEQRKLLARQYVGHSNAHDLDAIRAMLAPNARYSSSRVGEHSGADNIIAMMDGFFSDYPDVNWQVPEYRDENDSTVVFDFAMTATDAKSTEVIRRKGVERIEFDPVGLISWIDVQA